MNPLYRVILGLVFLCVFVLLFCFIWLESVSAQALGFGFVFIFSLLFISPGKLLKALWLLSPFILMLTGVYALFALLRIGEGRSYWLHYGLSRTLLFLSTLLFMQLLISRIKIDDLLSFPMSINKLKYIILGKLLFNEAATSYQQLCLFVEFIPTEQRGLKRFLRLLRKKLIVLLALVSYIINEATLKGEMIDERIKHCHN